MKKLLALCLTLLLIFSLAACDNGGGGNASQATPTSIEAVRYDFNILFDDLNDIRELLKKVSYDYEKDSIGFNPVYYEMLDIGQVMPTIDDYITVSDLETLEKRVEAVTKALSEVKEKAEALQN